MTKTVKVWNLEHLDFDIVCDLVFGIFYRDGGAEALQLPPPSNSLPAGEGEIL
jgi:hypothetical protein